LHGEECFVGRPTATAATTTELLKSPARIVESEGVERRFRKDPAARSV
jgi:hypothetical protein